MDGMIFEVFFSRMGMFNVKCLLLMAPKQGSSCSFVAAMATSAPPGGDDPSKGNNDVNQKEWQSSPKDDWGWDSNDWEEDDGWSSWKGWGGWDGWDSWSWKKPRQWRDQPHSWDNSRERRLRMRSMEQDLLADRISSS